MVIECCIISIIYHVCIMLSKIVVYVHVVRWNYAPITEDRRNDSREPRRRNDSRERRRNDSRERRNDRDRPGMTAARGWTTQRDHQVWHISVWYIYGIYIIIYTVYGVYKISIDSMWYYMMLLL